MRRKAGFISLLVIVTFTGSKGINDKDYCSITCRGAMHTVCAHPAASSQNQCERRGYRNVKHGLTAEEKETIVQYHNELRQKVASGQETRGLNRGQPAAKEMKILQWDDELEYIAQRWTDQCTASQGQLQHDKCRHRINNEAVGQNLAIQWEYRRDTPVKKLIDMWYDEVDDYDGNNAYKPYGQASNPNGKMIGHYTQLVNAETDRIGCGAVRYDEGDFRVLYLSCNYGPAGNWINKQAYIPTDSPNIPQQNFNQQQKQKQNQQKNKHQLNNFGQQQNLNQQQIFQHWPSQNQQSSSWNYQHVWQHQYYPGYPSNDQLSFQWQQYYPTYSSYDQSSPSINLLPNNVPSGVIKFMRPVRIFNII